MAPHSRGPKPVKGKKPHPSELTVIIVGKVGKSRRFRISSRMVTFAAVFLCLYILASILVFNAYFAELRAGKAQSALMGRLQRDINETKKALLQSREHLALLEEAVYDMRGSKEEPVKAPSQVPAAWHSEGPAPAKGRSEEKAEKRNEQALVGIRDFVFQKEEGKLTVSFKLVNRGDESNPISGFVHMIGVNRRYDPPVFLPYPRVRLKGDVPVEPQKGQLFFIKRFKTIRGEYPLDPQRGGPSAIRVLVYDHPGHLLFEKEFEVKNGS